MTSIWFRWERGPRRWCPVAYHDKDAPTVPKGMEGSYSPAYPVPDDCMHGGEPMFGKLAERFPAPDAQQVRE